MATPTRRPLTAEEKAKLAAEAESALAEAGLARTETRKMLAEAKMQELHLERARITRDRESFLRKVELSQDDFYNVYRFRGAVGGSSVAGCIEVLSSWNRTRPGEDITLVFNSPGGDVVAGMELYDFLTELKADGHHLTTVARGIAASMAGVLLQAGNRRIMGAEASLLIHQGSFGASGSVGEVMDTVEWVKKLQQRILDILSGRSEMKRADIAKRWERKDWWLTSDEALKYGFVDEVGGGGVV